MKSRQNCTAERNSQVKNDPLRRVVTILSRFILTVHTAGIIAADYIRLKGKHMLWTICMVLVILWLLGIVTSYTMGGLIHILLVIAIIVVLLRVIQGRKVL